MKKNCLIINGVFKTSKPDCFDSFDLNFYILKNIYQNICLPNNTDVFMVIDYDDNLLTKSTKKKVINKISNIFGNNLKYIEIYSDNNLNLINGFKFMTKIISNINYSIRDADEIENSDNLNLKNILDFDPQSFTNCKNLADLSNIGKKLGLNLFGLYQYHKFFISLNKIKKYEKENNLTYDFICKTRMDLTLNEHFNFESFVKPNNINYYYGFCDIIFVFNSYQINEILKNEDKIGLYKKKRIYKHYEIYKKILDLYTSEILISNYFNNIFNGVLVCPSIKLPLYHGSRWTFFNNIFKIRCFENEDHFKLVYLNFKDYLENPLNSSIQKIIFKEMKELIENYFIINNNVV